jgi:hypothetical protein
MSVNWILPARGLGKGNLGNFKDGVAGTLGKKGDGAQQMSISVRRDTMEAMRWVIGDRVLVGYDGNQKTIVMRRDPRGHKLTKPGESSSKNEGKCISSVVKITWYGTIPEDAFPFHVPLSDCVIDGVDLHFQPKAGSA